MVSGTARRVVRIIVASAGLAAAQSALADEPWSGLQYPHADWNVFAGAAYTSDATLAPNGPSDTIATAGFGGSLYQDTGRLKADLEGSVYYEDYLDDTYASHILGRFRGLATYAFVPERFTWTLQDTLGQLTLNPLLPTTPFNRVSANVFSTGPDVYMHLGGDVGLNLGARYGRADYQSNPDGELNDHRISGNVGLSIALAPTTTASLNARATRVEYQATNTPSYDEYDYYAQFATRSARAGLALDAGLSELRSNGATTNAPLAHLTAFRRLTPSWNLNVTAGEEFQNTANALQASLASTQVVNGQVVPGGTGGGLPTSGTPVANVILSTAVFRAQYAGLAFDFVRPRTTVDIHGTFTRQHYEFGAQALDRDLEDIGAGFTRRLRPSLSFRASAAYDRQKATDTTPGYEYRYADVGFDWRAGAMLTVTLAYHREDRPAQSPLPGYIENLVYLGLSYGPPKHTVQFQPPNPAGTGLR